MRSWSMPSARAVCSGTTANASLISHRSMSLTVMPAFLSALAEVGARGRHRADPCARLLPRLLAPLARAEQDNRRAVDDARRVARGVDVLDLLGVRVALERELIDRLAVGTHRHRAQLLERRCERR